MVSYTYDSWGKLISTTGSLASTVGVKNPYLYRGYRFDSETGLYYLQSRYYSPEWGRFINADGNLGSRGDLLSHNLFAYCKNNPVNYSDPNGEWFLDALFLAMDIAAFSSNPSLGSAAWILLDIVCFADPTGIGSTSAHVAKTAHVLEETAHVADAVSHTSEIAKGAGSAEKLLAPTIDRNTGKEVGRFIADEKGNIMIEPVGGKTVASGRGGVDTHTLYPNSSNYQRLNPLGHANNPTPHGHGHLEGTGPGMKGQGPSIDVFGNEVDFWSPGAHWSIYP